MYNKTALYRMKKDDLMKLFLDQQAEKNQLVLESEEHQKVKSHMIYMGHDKMKADLKKLKEENEKLKEENKKLNDEFKILNDFTPVDDYDGQAMVDWISSLFEHEDERYELEKETEKLKQQIDYAYKQINELMSKIQLSTI